MIQTSASLLKRLLPPPVAKTSSEKLLADQAAIRKLTWFDIAIIIVAALPLLYDRIERRAWLQVAIIGGVLGSWIPIVGLTSWLLLGH